MKLKRISVLFILMLVLSTFFSSFVFANNDESKCHCSIVALGDSITFGTSLNPNEKPFPSLITKLGAKENNVTNLGVSGQTSGQLLSSLNNATISTKVANADVITLYIGGNDLLQATGLTTILSNQDIGSLTEEQLAAMAANAGTAVQQLGVNLNSIIGKVRSLNGSAPIILYNLYNPIPNNEKLALLHQFGNQFITMINSNLINPAAQPQNGVYLADAFKAFDGKQEQYIINGEVIPELGIGVHPTEAGHQALAKLADRILAPLFPEKVLTVQLTPSTVDSTKEPVTIKVQTNAENAQAMKWLPGTKSVQDFQAAGTEIKDSAFQVTGNGIYTVYVKDECDREAVATIEIKNITKEEPSKENPNPGPGGTDTSNPAPTPNQNGTSNQNPAPQGDTTTITPVSSTTPPVSTVAATTGHKLPKTATPIYNYMAMGLALIGSGLIALKLQRRRKRESF